MGLLTSFHPKILVYSHFLQKYLLHRTSKPLALFRAPSSWGLFTPAALQRPWNIFDTIWYHLNQSQLVAHDLKVASAAVLIGLRVRRQYHFKKKKKKLNKFLFFFFLNDYRKWAHGYILKEYIWVLWNKCWSLWLDDEEEECWWSRDSNHQLRTTGFNKVEDMRNLFVPLFWNVTGRNKWINLTILLETKSRVYDGSWHICFILKTDIETIFVFSFIFFPHKF